MGVEFVFIPAIARQRRKGRHEGAKVDAVEGQRATHPGQAAGRQRDIKHTRRIGLLDPEIQLVELGGMPGRRDCSLDIDAAKISGRAYVRAAPGKQMSDRRRADLQVTG